MDPAHAERQAQAQSQGPKVEVVRAHGGTTSAPVGGDAPVPVAVGEADNAASTKAQTPAPAAK